jgi:hypothetical protein
MDLKMLKQRMPVKTNRFNQRLHPFFKNISQGSRIRKRYYFNI